VFGAYYLLTYLIARQNGKEAFSGFTSILRNVKEDETVYVDFEGVNTFSPSWGTNFLLNFIICLKIG